MILFVYKSKIQDILIPINNIDFEKIDCYNSDKCNNFKRNKNNLNLKMKKNQINFG